jgi:NDP-sugar pyrophosphorylase family protein
VKAVLLAAGAGTRLGLLTADRPKPMMDIDGQPAVAHSLRWLRRQGIDEVVINLHHHPVVLRDFVGDGSKFDLRVTYSLEEQVLGTSGALRPLRSVLRDEEVFCVLYGDVLTNLDLRWVRDAHIMSRPDATIVVTGVDDPTRAGMVVFDDQRRITSFVEKPAADQVVSEWANAGIYLCGPKVLDYVSAAGPQDFGRDLFPSMLQDGCSLLASPTSAAVIDFGSPERLEDARRAVRAGALDWVTAGQAC